jgi:hypothetical protein
VERYVLHKLHTAVPTGNVEITSVEIQVGLVANLDVLSPYCNVLIGSISQWNFIALKVQYTTVTYSRQLF